MSGIRPIIEAGIDQAIAEHPKYFSELGLSSDRARIALVRKIMAAVRGDAADKSSATESNPQPPAIPQPTLITASSREGRAFLNLCMLSGAPAPFRSADGRFSLPPEAANESVYALADLPPKSEWDFLTETKHIIAWREFFSESMPAGVARKPILHQRGDQQGILMPWRWPPSKTGTVYPRGSERAA